MTHLIVNADDFGQTKGVNAGIIEAHRKGVLTSTTLMANGQAFDDAVALAYGIPELGVGVHINLVEGRPVSPASCVGSLLDSSGLFLSKFALVRRHLSGRLRLDELRLEVAAQIDLVCQADVVPTHVDSHKHIHVYPAFFGIVAEVAESRGIGAIRLPWECLRTKDWFSHPKDVIRTLLLNTASRLSRRTLRKWPLATTACFAGTLRTGAVTASWLLDWLASLSGPTAELMVHPGKCDDDLLSTGTRLTTQREVELQALIDPRVVEAIGTTEIRLIHYGQLADPLLSCVVSTE